MFNPNVRGLVLVEALLAVVILGSGITLVVQSLSASRRNVAKSLEFTQALFVLDNQLSKILESKNKENVPFESDLYSFKFEPSAVTENQETTFLKEMQAVLSWKSGARTNDLSINTYLFNPPDEPPN